MATKIRLDVLPTPKQERWLEKHVGPKLAHLHNYFGGTGWRAQIKRDDTLKIYVELEIDNPELATFFIIKFL